MKIIVLGAAAGGGFPQWNAASANNRLAYANDASCPQATQCSLAISVDGTDWLLLNASPDIRQQILATPELHPRNAPRSSPIKSIILTGADIDAIAGLLSLREGQPLTVWATDFVLEVINANPLFGVLDRSLVDFRTLPTAQDFGPLQGLTARTLASPGKPPLYLEKSAGIAPIEGSSIGVRLTSAKGKTLSFMPSCAEITPDIIAAIDNTDALFFDGTLSVDDEMILSGEGRKTARRMGHVSMDQAMLALRNINARQRFFIHINNTNPALNRTSKERQTVEAAGWRIAEDGMRIEL